MICIFWNPIYLNCEPQRPTTDSLVPRRLLLMSLVSSTPTPSKLAARLEIMCSRGEERSPKQLLILKGTLTLTTVPSSTSAWTESLPESRVASLDLSTTRSPSSVMLPRTSQSGQSCLSFSSTRCFISSKGILTFCQFSLLLNQLLSLCKPIVQLKPTWLNIDLQ